jgi:Family of unknown function (DUF5681)
MDDPYTVGYGKPPKKSQFKKGQSGNPRGRPKKWVSPKEPLSFEKAFIAELKSKITISEAGRTKKITMLEALAKSLVTHALKGDKAAMRYVLAQLSKLPPDAFFEDGDGIYTWRGNEDTMRALKFLVDEVGNYQIPEEGQDGSSPSSS